MNTEALPGSLDFVQCVDGKNTIIQDYTKVEGWQNAEVLNSIAQIERSLNTREAVSVPAENVFQSNTPEEPDSDRYEIYSLRLIQPMQNYCLLLTTGFMRAA